MPSVVGFVRISRKKKLPIVLDAVTTKDTHFGVSVNYMLVSLNIKLSTVDSVRIFHATSL